MAKIEEPVGTRTWALIALGCSGLMSAIAVGIVKADHEATVARNLWRVAEGFASPGEFIWWATMGGPFTGYPSGLIGHFVWVVGSALFWFVIAMVCIAARVALRRVRGKRWRALK